MMVHRYIEAARQEAEKCWCDDGTSSKQVEHAPAEAFAKRLTIWMETAAMMSRNVVFYRGLLDQCARHIGREAYTADDGTVCKTPIRLKIPELVAELVRKEKR